MHYIIHYYRQRHFFQYNYIYFLNTPPPHHGFLFHQKQQFEQPKLGSGGMRVWLGKISPKVKTQLFSRGKCKKFYTGSSELVHHVKLNKQYRRKLDLCFFSLFDFSLMLNFLALFFY